ncbi:MAG TPA: sigma-70 family RNA polymerase sigma factor [Thermomicrobiales bacterium]|jgi:RNA polymerase sigma-70 factor (ECF subfamily)|nr:sigma-70 family RNA polymerase sigma factor [Thermomicrobiales bacterium]
MPDSDWLASQFEDHRDRLRAVAYRVLGSRSEAEDAVQEAWLRLSRTDTSDVENFGGWLTTVVSRISLDMLRSRGSRREDRLGPQDFDGIVNDSVESEPERAAVLADSVGPALLVVLETLTPAERLAFVLHDVFGVPYEEIAPIIERNPAAARQLASRARRRVRGASMVTQSADQVRRYAIVDAFLAAARDGDFDALIGFLDPNVVLRADQTAVEMGTAPEIRGPREVAGRFVGGAKVARTAIVDGAAGAVWMSGKQPRIAFRFTFMADLIAAIEIVADPARLATLDIALRHPARD